MNQIQNSMRTPRADEYNSFYGNYVQGVPEGNVLDILESQISELRGLFEGVSDEAAEVRHTPYTWTLKQVVGHLIDAERIFADRMHRIASGDFQPLPGMEQDPYVANNDYESPRLADLLDELILCRRANLLLARRIKPEAWDNRGIASGFPITARALAYILAGHIVHHVKVIRKRLKKS